MLVKPVPLPHHLEGGVSLFRLVVIVERPGQVRDRKKHDDERQHNSPNPRLLEPFAGPPHNFREMIEAEAGLANQKRILCKAAPLFSFPEFLA